MASQVGPQPLSNEDINEKLAALERMPLFMKSLPSDAADDPIVAALQDLAYEGTPNEIAVNFKEQGNEYFKGKRYREALGFYTQGIDAHPEDQSLLEGLLCNRAACNLELKNYGSVLRDCSKVLGINHTSSKAYYRSAAALMALDRPAEALDCCDRCLVFDPDNQAMKGTRVRALRDKEAFDRRERMKDEKKQKEQEEKQKMKRAFKERNLVDVPNPAGSANPYAPHWAADDPTMTTLTVPVFFLYPQYATSDVIAEFREDTSFAEHLEAMFPPSCAAPAWDAKNEYVYGQLVVYALTRRQRLLKVGKRMTLRDVCRHAKEKDGEPADGLEVKDGCLSFVVLPKGDAETQWMGEYKKGRKGDGGCT